MSTVITDDLDGSSGAEVVSFSVNGVAYEIDLGPASQGRLHASLQPFITADRLIRQKQKPGRTPPARTDYAAIRSWALGQGLRVTGRGRISAEVISKYDAAHQGTG